ncbi:MAG: class I SAM-dependent methyltransferase [Ardenticatenaceae bacterium]|nr:class I SAM-dependent methyltransferase [Ardenticatenaceae bacterium]
MRDEIVQRLLNLNQEFYDAQADSFSGSRVSPQPGFARLLPYLPQPCPRFLDVGCGNGRFAQFLQENNRIGEFVGVDFSEELLADAAQNATGTFYQRNLLKPGCLDGLGQFPAISCLAVMHHLPGKANRLRLLQEIKTHLVENGRLLISNWQFMDSPRQRRKVQNWSQLGLTADDVEPNDYLLAWQRGGFALRYACHINAAETAELAAQAGLTIVDQFYSDGKEGNLSLYTVLTPTLPMLQS